MNLVIDETYYLTPKTLGAPAICFKQLQVTLVAIRIPYVAVRLVNGDEHEVHMGNLVRNLPEPPANTRPPQPPARRLDLPEDMEEVTLW